MNDDEFEKRLCGLANKIEQRRQKERIPQELRELFGDNVYSVEAEGWSCFSDYIVSLSRSNSMIDSHNVKDLSALDGYELHFVVWGNERYVDESDVELCISEVDSE